MAKVFETPLFYLQFVVFLQKSLIYLEVPQRNSERWNWTGMLDLILFRISWFGNALNEGNFKNI